MSRLDFQEKIQKEEVYQQILSLFSASFENYNIKKVSNSTLEEIRDDKTTEVLKVWCESESLVKVKALASDIPALAAEMIVLAMDLISILGVSGLKLQLSERYDSDLFRKYFDFSSLQYDFFQSQESDFIILLQVDGENIELCKSEQLGFYLDLENLHIALKAQEISVFEPIKLHVYLCILSEKVDIEASRLVFSLRQQGYSADRDYHVRDTRENILLEHSSADLLLQLGDDELKRQKVRLVNLEDMRAQEYALSEIYSDFSHIYEEVVMRF